MEHKHKNTFIVVENDPSAWTVAGAEILASSFLEIVWKEFTSDDFPAPHIPTKRILYVFLLPYSGGVRVNSLN